MITSDKKMHPSAGRMRDLRERLRYAKPGKFAKMLDISVSRWSNVENGAPISHAIATRLREKIPGITYDFIYTGDTKYLDEKMKILLGVQVDAVTLQGLPLGDDGDKPAKKPRKPRKKALQPGDTKRKTV
jgi:hypothetical protein